MYALSHFELNKYFGTCETWGSAEIQERAGKLFGTAIHLWPRPPVTASKPPATEKTAPAGFHTECVRLVQAHLGIHLSKVLWESKTASDTAVNAKEVKLITSFKANDPAIGYNRWPKFRGASQVMPVSLPCRKK